MNARINLDNIKYTDEDLLSVLNLMGIRTNGRDASSVRREVLHKMMQLINDKRYDTTSRKIIECLHNIIIRLSEELSMSGEQYILFEDIFDYEEYEESDELECFLEDFCIKGVASSG